MPAPLERHYSAAATVSRPTSVQLVLPDSAPWQPDEPIDREQIAVLAALRCADGPVRKETLQLLAGLEERAVRGAIEGLRRGLWPIVSHPGRAGYALTFDGAELALLERDLGQRAMSLLRTRRAIRVIRSRRAA